MSINLRSLDSSLSSFGKSLSSKRKGSGFSIVELLIVMAIAGMLMALSAPALLEVGPSRKAASIELTGFLDRARTLAVARNERVYVAFANENHPTQDLRFRAYSIFLENPNFEEERSLLNGPLVQNTEWMTLPKGMLFGTAELFQTDPTYAFRTLHDLQRPRPFAISSTSKSLFPFLVFDSSGRVVYPSLVDADALNLVVTEGTLDSSGNGVVPTGGTSNEATPRAELIRIASYTGRSSILTD